VLSEKERNEVAQIQATMRKRLETLRADSSVVPRERQRRMAQAVIDAREAVKAIKDKADARQGTEQDAAYKTLFGLNAGRAAEDRSYRDSLAARVDEGSLDANRAAALYNLAVTRGDELGMTALAELAWQHSGDEMGATAWHPILDAHRGQSDELGNAMTSLVALVNPDKISRMREKLELEVVQPEDLPGNLEWLAGDEDSLSGGTAQNWSAG
jgi:hypothetical protein